MDSNYFWLLKACLGIVALVGIQYVIRKMLSRIEKKSQAGLSAWKGRASKVWGLPLSMIIWVLGATYLIDLFDEHIGFFIAVPYLDALRKVVVVGCMTWIFYRWKCEVERSLLNQPSKKVDATTVRMLGKLSTMVVIILSGLLVLQIMGVNIAPLLAFGSIGAASIGFAGKDVIANFCSGIIIYITRPFVMGDHIYLPEKDIEGQIEEIGWFRTSVRDKEKRPVYFPNNFFSTLLLVNVSRMTHRRIKQHLKIGFNSIPKISECVDKMRAYLEKSPYLDRNCPLHVFLKNFGDYACEIEIEAYSTLTNEQAFNQFQQTLLVDLQAILEQMDVHLAVPVTYWKQQ